MNEDLAEGLPVADRTAVLFFPLIFENPDLFRSGIPDNDTLHRCACQQRIANLERRATYCKYVIELYARSFTALQPLDANRFTGRNLVLLSTCSEYCVHSA